MSALPTVEDVTTRLAGIRARIEAAGGDPARVAVLAVTKGHPIELVDVALAAGLVDLGENYAQELLAKTAGHEAVRWHFIGGLQSNKAAAVAGYCDVVESVDRVKLVAPLQRVAQARGRDLDVLVQVSLDPVGASNRSGVDPKQLDQVAAAVAAAPQLRLRGLMAVAPLGEDPAVAFARLPALREGFLLDHPEATTLSAGMSGDLEQAVFHGATHVRVGSAVLGPRPAVQ